ncbi:unnamed protein product [Didymodactylos carnosus]|uniref:Uncharacterized protein n=1 Tax=Didymodactylos carnosus TaxID=1234261 RepID=A0A815E5T4_9BILA|nr:unnamed protein product [Didymodactylos carnosus]CAF1308029.1 unnamed protein product [Didymodactylos carnosus]CAF4073477.1 unnamed protein product [Didymodactylos carnosus]CAF4142857.1 unnamed protein product [Didymodactylos carnosus]
MKENVRPAYEDELYEDELETNDFIPFKNNGKITTSSCNSFYNKHIILLLDIVEQLIEGKFKEKQQETVTTSCTYDQTAVYIGILRSTIQDVNDIIQQTSKNEYQFIRLCKEHFNYYQPVEISMSGGATRDKDAKFYYISIKESLINIFSKQEMYLLLRNHVIQQQVKVLRDPYLMYSFRDGSNGQNIDPHSFLLQLYSDGVGLTNPIGAKKDQHKVTLVYFLLEDIPEVFRSTLQCINLVAICYTKYLSNENLRKFYQPIVKELNDLQLNGLMINGNNETLRFKFSTFSADNLAANEIGGFQQTFSHGHFCRRCLISYKNRIIPLTDLTIIQRTENRHEQYVEQVINQNGGAAVFGVTRMSPLDELDGFYPTISLPGDIMHDLFEGSCPIVIIAMLKEASALRLISYPKIQERMENFIYGTMDSSDKPPAIQVKHLNLGRISRSAAQKLLLFKLFPLIFHDITQNLETFEIYLTLREMLGIILAYPSRKSWLPHLNQLGILFQCLMANLLPDKMIPKIHFSTEYDKTMEQCGPPTKFWCMRYEGKHAYFKKVALRSNNFKNMPKTLAQRHQLRNCLFLWNTQSLKEYAELRGIKLIQLHRLSQTVQNALIEKYGRQQIEQMSQLQECSSFTHKHILYKQAAVYVHNLLHVEEIPIFFQIIHILKIHNQWIFLIDQFLTERYDKHLCSYKLTSNDLFTIVSPQNLTYYHKEEEVDGKTLLLMKDVKPIDSFLKRYKHQLLFLAEREKLFGSDALSVGNNIIDDNSEQNSQCAGSSSIYDHTQRQNENYSDTLRDDIPKSVYIRNDQEPHDILTIFTSSNELASHDIEAKNEFKIDKKQLTSVDIGNLYVVPDLPDTLKQAIEIRDLAKFGNHCNFRRILSDTVFHDLTTNYNLWYPTTHQYDSIARGIINSMKILSDEKTLASAMNMLITLFLFCTALCLNSFRLQLAWKRTMISKFKDERQSKADTIEQIKAHKIKYSRLESGRPIKKQAITTLADRDPEKKIILQSDAKENENEVENLKDELKIAAKNENPDAKLLLNAWSKTIRYRRDFVRTHKIADIIEQFPTYKQPCFIYAEIEMLTGLNIEVTGKLILNELYQKLLTENTAFLTDAMPLRLIKVLCGIFEETWKHYIFTSGDPSSPQPSIKTSDEAIELWVDWTVVLRPKSAEEAIILWLALYHIYELKFPYHSRVVRFMYVILFNEKRYASNSIRKILKLYGLDDRYLERTTKLFEKSQQQEISDEVSRELKLNNDHPKQQKTNNEPPQRQLPELALTNDDIDDDDGEQISYNSRSKERKLSSTTILSKKIQNSSKSNSSKRKGLSMGCNNLDDDTANQKIKSIPAQPAKKAKRSR